MNEAITEPEPAFLRFAGGIFANDNRMNSMARTACAGAIAGVAGTLAMNVAQRLWTLAAGDRPPESAAGPHDARDWQEREEGRNSNEVAAQTVATMFGRPLSDRELAVAALMVHLSFGAAVGAAYAVYVMRREKRPGTGLGLGTALWLTADEIAMPVLGLSRSTLQRSPEKHLQSLVAHFVYGVATEGTRRLTAATF
ncbi:MAG TPA: DUF1440 domain-containing protein [Vicinamibacterales bacterium]